MTALAIAMTVLGALTCATGVLVWWTAVTTDDYPNVTGGALISKAGRYGTAVGILLWLGGSHPAGVAMEILLIAAVFFAAISFGARPAPPHAPRFG